MTDWTEVTLGDVATLIKRGKAPKYVEDGGAMVLNQKCIRPENKVQTGHARRTDVDSKPLPDWAFLQAGDLLVNSTGRGTLGRASLWDGETTDRVTVDSHISIVRVRPELVSPEFLGALLSSRQSDLERLQSGSTNQTELSPKALSSLRLQLPPLDAQRRIADVVRSVDAVVDALEAEARAVDDVRAGMVEAVLGSLPGDDVRLNEVLDIVRGGSPRPIDNYFTDDADGLNWVKIGDVPPDGKYVTGTKQRIKPSGLSKTRFIRAGSFILSNSMSFGRPYIMRIDGCIHDGWLALTDSRGVFDQDFLYYLLRSRGVQDQFDQLAAGSGVRNLNIKVAGSVLVRLPSIGEQREAVKRLNSLYASGDALRAELGRARSLRASLLDELLSGQRPIPESYDRFLAEVA